MIINSFSLKSAVLISVSGIVAFCGCSAKCLLFANSVQDISKSRTFPSYPSLLMDR